MTELEYFIWCDNIKEIYNLDITDFFYRSSHCYKDRHYSEGCPFHTGNGNEKYIKNNKYLKLINNYSSKEFGINPREEGYGSSYTSKIFIFNQEDTVLQFLNDIGTNENSIF